MQGLSRSYTKIILGAYFFSLRKSSVNGIDIDSAYSFIFLVKNSKLYDNKVSKETINKKLDEFLKLNPKIKKNEIIKEGTRVILPTKTPENKLVVRTVIQPPSFVTFNKDLKENDKK